MAWRMKPKFFELLFKVGLAAKYSHTYTHKQLKNKMTARCLCNEYFILFIYIASLPKINVLFLFWLFLKQLARNVSFGDAFFKFYSVCVLEANCLIKNFN